MTDTDPYPEDVPGEDGTPDAPEVPPVEDPPADE